MPTANSTLAKNGVSVLRLIVFRIFEMQFSEGNLMVKIPLLRKSAKRYL